MRSPPGTARRLKHLREPVHPHGTVDGPGYHQRIAVRKRRARRVPATGVQARPGRDAGVLGAAPLLGEDATPSEQLARPLGGDLHLAVALALGDFAGDFAADRADLAFEVAHAGFPRVILDEAAQSRHP